MLIYRDERERRILERRLELLDILDNVPRRDILLGVTTDADSDELKKIGKEFVEVHDPHEVIEVIKRIYRDRPDLFGGSHK